MARLALGALLALALAVAAIGVGPSKSNASTRATPPPAVLPPIRQPNATSPLRILSIGDSLGEDLEIGLSSELGGNRTVQLIPKAVGDTGLSDVAYYNWSAELESDLARYHPQVVTVMLGGNDVQSFPEGKTTVWPGTGPWISAYTQRVARLMGEATAAGAHVIWVGLPIMGPSSGLDNAEIRLENAIYRQQARRRRGVVYASTWQLFSTRDGQYSSYLTGPTGQLVTVRDPDEVHIDPGAGTGRLGAYVLTRMQRAWHIRI